MYYRGEIANLNFLIKIIIKIFNKHYKLATKICYSNSDDKIKPYYKHTSYYNRRSRTNNKLNNSYKTMLIKQNLSWQSKRVNFNIKINKSK